MRLSDADLMKIGDEKVRRLLADALQREYTCLSSIGHEVFNLAGEIEEIDLDELRRADPETILDELRRIEVASGRLSAAFHDLTEKADDFTR